ncbi:MAG: hypothetical protein ACAH80_02915 [Alphaproteobacteria bacterium]
MPRKLSEFLFRGADVRVDGREETIMELEKRNSGPGKGLTLHFVSGRSVKYSQRTVKPIPGRIPEFIQEGAKLRVTDRKAGRHGMPPVLDWTISSFEMVKEGNRRPRLRLVLKVGSAPTVCIRDFNAATMVPVNYDPKPAETKQTITVRNKPLQFKPPGQP